LRVVARHADVWINASPYGTSLEELVRLSAVLDEHCRSVGRDPAEIRRAVQVRLPDDEDEAMRLIADLATAGFQDVVIAVMARGAAAVPAAEAAAKLLPRLRSAASD
jgi:alkanesulfonate monooxygenase SsuD/methylene tetrahydromethanopterin reductase-like flavin-dependent oxidoreductase (luciferase family)